MRAWDEHGNVNKESSSRFIKRNYYKLKCAEGPHRALNNFWSFVNHGALQALHESKCFLWEAKKAFKTHEEHKLPILNVSSLSSFGPSLCISSATPAMHTFFPLIKQEKFNTMKIKWNIYIGTLLHFTSFSGPTRLRKLRQQRADVTLKSPERSYEIEDIFVIIIFANASKDAAFVKYFPQLDSLIKASRNYTFHQTFHFTFADNVSACAGNEQTRISSRIV